MVPAALFQTRRTDFAAQIDATAGIISRVAVITEGPALGHGMMVDATTLAQVKSCAEQYSGGLKVKMNHDGGVDSIVGSLKNFAIEAGKLFADLHLLNSAPSRAYVLELAEKMSDGFGLSVAFSGVADEKSGVRFARCSEIYSCDLVSEPAANPDGLFSRRFDEWQKDKGIPAASAATVSRNTQQLSKMENELLTQIGALIDGKLSALSEALNARFTALETANAASGKKVEEVAEMSKLAADKAALAAVKEFSKTLGAPAGAAAAPSSPPPAPTVKKFEELVREHAEYSKSKNKAIVETIKANGKEYADYQFRVQNQKDVILF